jgi:protoporphyrin/coproporphyrin ferrochelatase
VADPIAIVGLNLGGPDSLDAVAPFLYNLFRDPDVIHLGLARPLQPLLARFISWRRAPLSRAAYAQIGGKSPILDETRAQIGAVADAVSARGLAARPFVAMSCSDPSSIEAVDAVSRNGLRRAIALPLFPQYSDTTTGSSFKALARAVAIAGGALDVARIRSYPAAPGFIDAVARSITVALATLPDEFRSSAPVVFSAHGLPESYVQKGDPYLDEIRTTVAAVARRLHLGNRAHLAFQSRVGRQRWLGPGTEQVLDELAGAGTRAVVVCPIAFTGEHVETLQELDIVYRQRANARGLSYFARARTVGTDPAFIGALADLCMDAARVRGWI